MARTGRAAAAGVGRIVELSGKKNPAPAKKFWQRREDIVHHCGVQIDPDALPNDLATLQQMLRELSAENDKLRLLIQRLTRHQFGQRSEQLTVEQLQLVLEDQEQADAEHVASEAA